MKFIELKNKSLSELETLLTELKNELFLLRFKNSTSRQDKTHKIPEIRKDIARVLTAIREKQISNKGDK
ncbi:50S ribosomal protein L29 [Mesomycoplasma neurolyticum]|uniref:Large ribosomal subunit protein uL29 n=1 Tax=Mesomycoplasma neurolyticum TaxID=2120 RepID=A0A449A671_9BACT|nr:50S ribosomal protein L29 [Mesomycoplasma neurolyticum]VEU59734.1 50S ribosomal protein L29 [Mesomycoplasma neurolyticum]